MTDLYYPPLELSQLQQILIVAQLAQEHPAYFLTSPYSQELEQAIRQLLKIKPPQVEVKEGATDAEVEAQAGGRWEYLYTETRGLFVDLKNSKVSSGETSEQMAYFRTATALMEKLIALQERALGLKEIHEFQKGVLDVMEAVLTPAQRTEVMEKLKNLSGG